MRRILAAVLLSAICAGATLESRIDALLRSTKLPRATWGLKVIELGKGRTLYQKNPANFLAPASNAKLLSTALALIRLGPAYRFETTIRARHAPDHTGRLAGDLELIGGGDPSLSGRLIPFDKDAPAGNPLAAIESLADSVVAKGVRRIYGDVIGDDTAYLWEPYPEGWTLDDAIWSYGATVSALTVNDGSLTLKIGPADEAGEPAEITLSPAAQHFVIHNHVETIASGAGRIDIHRLPNSRELYVWGAIPIGQRLYTQELAADDPAQFAAELLYDALARRGVAIAGRPFARHRRVFEAPPVQGTVELARRTSPPMIQLIKIVNKVSQNLHAEILLREVARAKTGEGSLKAGLEELAAFLREVGITPDEYRLSDGSGLSRQDKLTPAALVKLLVYMYRSPHRDAWIDSLPIGGVDGTLKMRFDRRVASRAAGRRISAKTGTLDHARSLSGYAMSKSRGPLAFSIMVNNFADSSEIREIVDRIGVLLTE